MTSDPLAGEKLRSVIDLLATEYSSSTNDKASALVDAYLPNPFAAEQVQDLIGDVIFRFLLASAKQIREGSTDSTFDEALDRFISLKTRLTGALAKRLRQNLKQAVLTSEEARPKSERR